MAKPVAKAYVKVTPAPVRTGLGNFFRNLTSPTVIVNDLLQLKVKGFANDTARLVVNTTIGIGGLFDPASQLGLAAGDEDFGQTLGRLGRACRALCGAAHYWALRQCATPSASWAISSPIRRPMSTTTTSTTASPRSACRPARRPAGHRRCAEPVLRSLRLPAQCLPAAARIPGEGWQCARTGSGNLRRRARAIVRPKPPAVARTAAGRRCRR